MSKLETLMDKAETADNDTDLDMIEHIIETLDTAYLLGDPTIHPNTKKLISDAEYDQDYGQNGLYRRILKDARPDSRIFKAVTAAKVDFSAARKVKHNPPMSSIDKADGGLPHKQKKLGEWMLNCLSEMKIQTTYDRSIFAFEKGNSIATFEHGEKAVIKALTELAETKDAKGRPVFVHSLKHDGCAVSIYYEKGKLKEAGNRPRDGINAASVLDHVRYVTGIPNSLLQPLTIAIRGEIECHISDFEQVNADASAAGKKTYENPRNATAGAMNPLGDPKVAKERKLQFTGYSIQNFDDAPYETAMERAIWANKTLKVPFIRINPFKYSELQRIEDEVRAELDYQIDGIIIEVNDLVAGEAMGRHGSSASGDPHCLLAWKFAAETAIATVAGINWGVGKHGRVVPVATFPGIRLAGTTVVNCTLHNIGLMIDGKVGVGAKIRVQKSGEIIPMVLETIEPAKTIEHPDKCPSCGSKLIIRTNGDNRDLVCENTDGCPAQNVGKLVGYLSTIGVKGIAESIVTTLIGGGIVRSYADFYKINIHDMKVLGFSEREATLIFARIHMIEQPDKQKDSDRLAASAEKASQKKKIIPLHTLLASLSIPGSSKGTGRALSDHFISLNDIRKATKNDLLSVAEIGDKTATVLEQWFKDHAHEVDDLLKYVEPEAKKTGDQSGQVYCFSGSFSEGKEHWIKVVEDRGATIVGSPSRKVSRFIYGPGSGLKSDKAHELKAAGVNIEILDVDELKDKLGIKDADDDRTF